MQWNKKVSLQEPKTEQLHWILQAMQDLTCSELLVHWEKLMKIESPLYSQKHLRRINSLPQRLLFMQEIFVVDLEREKLSEPLSATWLNIIQKHSDRILIWLECSGDTMICMNWLKHNLKMTCGNLWRNNLRKIWRISMKEKQFHYLLNGLRLLMQVAEKLGS